MEASLSLPLAPSFDVWGIECVKRRSTTAQPRGFYVMSYLELSSSTHPSRLATVLAPFL
jgi:hypothetical protein